MSKNKIIVLVVLVVAIFGFAYYVSQNKQEVVPVVVTPEAPTPVTPQGEVCYFKATVGEESTDNAFTSVNYDAGGKVHGIINWIPGEKDSLVGAYTGVVEASNVPGYPTRLNILYTASGEGIVNRQQEILIVGASGIKTGVGEKYQDTDGVFKFKDINTLTYDNALPQVDCATVPERIKADYSSAN